jgi:hypothetical protein
MDAPRLTPSRTQIAQYFHIQPYQLACPWDRKTKKNGEHFRQYVNSIDVLTSAGTPAEIFLFGKTDPSGILNRLPWLYFSCFDSIMRSVAADQKVEAFLVRSRP